MSIRSSIIILPCTLINNIIGRLKFTSVLNYLKAVRSIRTGRSFFGLSCSQAHKGVCLFENAAGSILRRANPVRPISHLEVSARHGHVRRRLTGMEARGTR